jgi:hypothetical protein
MLSTRNGPRFAIAAASDQGAAGTSIKVNPQVVLGVRNTGFLHKGRTRLAAPRGGHYNQGFLPVRGQRPVLGGRPTVGRMPLEHVIGVRIPASQPSFARLRRATARQASHCRRRMSRRSRAAAKADPASDFPYAKSVSPKLAQECWRAKADHTRDSNAPKQTRSQNVRPAFPNLRNPAAILKSPVGAVRARSSRHARHRQALRLHPSQSVRSQSPLHRSHGRRWTAA